MAVTFESVLEHAAVAVLMMVVLLLTSHDIETADLAVRCVGNGVVFVVAVVVVVLSVAVTCACSNPDVAVGAFALKVTIFETAGLNVVAVVVVQVVAVVVVPDVHSNLQGGCLVKWKTLCLHHKPLFSTDGQTYKI
jgi:hypothetical protein